MSKRQNLTQGSDGKRETISTVLLTLVCASLAISQTIVVTTDTLARPMPLIGLNTNAHHSIATWTIPAFRESTAVLKSAILRYPGGTTANYWDWKTGWFQNAQTTPPDLSGIRPVGTVRAEELKLGLEAAEANALFVLNFQYSDISYQMDGLRHAAALGIPVRYVELGNEHNLVVSNQFVPPSRYGSGAAVWTDSIKREYPSAMVCLVGGSPPNQPGWNDSLFAYHPNIDALAFHVYLGAGNADSVFNVKRALSVPFAKLDQRYVQSKFPSIPSNVNIWVTEFNLSENLNGEPMQHAETWTHALYVAAMLHIFLENPKITMVVNHNLTNQLEFAAISPFDYHITANGIVMQLLGEVSKGMAYATRLRFLPTPAEHYDTTSYPALVGWRFTGSGVTTAFIVNLSSSARTLDLSSISAPGATFQQYSGDTAAKISGKQNLVATQGALVGPILFRPYSILQIWSGPTTSISRAETAPQGIWLSENYPNPFNPETTIRFRLEESGRVRLSIHDVLGREVRNLVDGFHAGGWNQAVWDGLDDANRKVASGVYYYKLVGEKKSIVRKMVLLK